MNSNNVKIVVFVPETHTDIVREAIGKAGAGKIGNYTYCSFSTKGVGRFKPEKKRGHTLDRLVKSKKLLKNALR